LTVAIVQWFLGEHDSMLTSIFWAILYLLAGCYLSLVIITLYRGDIRYFGSRDSILKVFGGTERSKLIKARVFYSSVFAIWILFISSLFY
jgi:hypothetical protein